MIAWDSDVPPPNLTPDLKGWMRVAMRGPALVVAVYGGLVVFLLVRLFEWPFGRPVSPSITQFVCRSGLSLLGIAYRVAGTPMRHSGLVVANHVSWLDIFALNAAQRVFFVAKHEVRSWLGIGILARATGAVFIERNVRHAARQKIQFQDRLVNGDRLLFFPEGTSTDGLRVLGFKSSLFSVVFEPGLAQNCYVQPVSLIYRPPREKDPRFYGFWGEVQMRTHVIAMLAAPRGGSIEAVYHEPLRAQSYPDRKALSLHCEKVVRERVEQGLRSGIQDQVVGGRSN